MVLSGLLLYLINHYISSWPPVTLIGEEYSCCAMMYEKTESGMTLEEVKQTYYCGYQQLVPINHNGGQGDQYNDIDNITENFTVVDID